MKVQGGRFSAVTESPPIAHRIASGGRYLSFRMSLDPGRGRPGRPGRLQRRTARRPGRRKAHAEQAFDGEEGLLSDIQYRIGTILFPKESCPTWATRSEQVLDSLARWGREGWRISRLNGTQRVALGSSGLCLLLERDLGDGRRVVARRRSRWGSPGGTCRIPLGAKAS